MESICKLTRTRPLYPIYPHDIYKKRTTVEIGSTQDELSSDFDREWNRTESNSIGRERRGNDYFVSGQIDRSIRNFQGLPLHHCLSRPSWGDQRSTQFPAVFPGAVAGSGSPIERALLVIAVIVYTNNREIKRVFTSHAPTISTRVSSIPAILTANRISTRRVQRRRTNVSVGYQAPRMSRGLNEIRRNSGLTGFEGKVAISRGARVRICYSILAAGSNVPLKELGNAYTRSLRSASTYSSCVTRCRCRRIPSFKSFKSLII